MAICSGSANDNKIRINSFPIHAGNCENVVYLVINLHVVGKICEITCERDAIFPSNGLSSAGESIKETSYVSDIWWKQLTVSLATFDALRPVSCLDALNAEIVVMFGFGRDFICPLDSRRKKKRKTNRRTGFGVGVVDKRISHRLKIIKKLF